MKSILVIGMGRFGRRFAEKMLELGNDVMIVDKSSDIITSRSAYFTDSYIGDCTSKEVIRALGVSNFDLCLVAIGEDFQPSLVITSLLKEHGAKYVVSKARQDIQADLLKKIGADEVIYPERDMAEKLAVRFNATNLFDFIDLTEEYAIFEIAILEDWVGMTVAEANVRKKYKVNIIAVKTDGHLNPMPGGDYRFRAGDHLVIIGKAADVNKLSNRI